MKDKICFKIYAYETVEIQGKKGVPNKEEILNKHVKFDINSNNNKEQDKKEEKNGKSGKSMVRFKTSTNLRKTLTKSVQNTKDKDCIII